MVFVSRGVKRHTVLAGNVVVVTLTLVGVGIFKHEQAEVMAGPPNLDRQVGRAMGVGPAGGGGGGGGGGEPGLPGGGGALLAIRAGVVGDIVGTYVALISQVDVVETATTG